MSIRRRAARPGWPLLALLPVLALGCGRAPPPAPADPDKARETLRTALEAWREGGTPASLKERSPPIYVNDRDWEAGRRLARYEVQDKAEHYGSQFRCSVRLSLHDARGNVTDRTVKYLIDTQPALVIVRDDF